jgi:molecular chaperone DnaK
MVKDAELHAEEDRKKKEEVEVRNQADNLMYQTEKVLKENREKLSESDIRAVEEALKDTKAAVESGNSSAIKEKMEILTKASHHMAEAMYKAQSQQQGAGAQPPPGGGESGAGGDSGRRDDDVVDAEFEDTGK